MALPIACPGPAPISLLDIQSTFGGFYPTGIAEYYRDAGILSPTDEGTIGVPYAGSQISFADFFCKYPIYTINLDPNRIYDDQYDICYQFKVAFGDAAWTGPGKKILNIPSTTSLVATTSSAALFLWDRVTGMTDGQLGGGLTINNAGSVYGLGGNQWSFATDNNGGPAFEIYNMPKIRIKLNNTGKFVGGGGGGGRGGFGPQRLAAFSGDPAYGEFNTKFEARSIGGVGGDGRGGNRLDLTNTVGAPPYLNVDIDPAAPAITAPATPPNYTCMVDANTNLNISHIWLKGFTATFYLAAKNPNQNWILNIPGSNSNVAIDTINLYLSSNCNDVIISAAASRRPAVFNVNIIAAPNSGTVKIQANNNTINISESRSSTSGAITVTGTSLANSTRTTTITESNPSYNIPNFSSSGDIGNFNIPSALTTAGYGGAGGDYGQSGSKGIDGSRTAGSAGGSTGPAILRGTNVFLPFTADSTLGTLIGPYS
jgi:hypothetical protein